MKKILKLLVLVTSLVLATLPAMPVSAINTTMTRDWVYTVGGTGADTIMDILIAADNSVYIVGAFTGTVDFDPGAGTTNGISAGSTDAFAAKFTSEGSLLWVRTWGGTNLDEANSIIELSSGNILIGGQFAGTSDLNPGAGTASVVSVASRDMYMTIVDGDGAYVDSMATGGTGQDYIHDMLQQSDGSIAVTGQFTGTVDLDPSGSSANHISVGGEDAYIASYDTDLSYEWSRAFGSTGHDTSYNIGQDSSDILYIGGWVAGNTNFNPSGTADNWAGQGGTDAYIAKYQPDGTYIDTIVFGGADAEWIYSIEVTDEGDLAASGSFCGTTDFDPGAGAQAKTSAGDCDGFVMYLEADGALRWVKTVQGSDGFEDAPTLAIDDDGYIYIHGESYSTDFHFEGGDDNYSSDNTGHIYLGKYDPSDGDLVLGKAWGYNPTDGGSQYSFYAWGLTVDPEGSVYLGTCLSGTNAYLDPSETDTHTSAGSCDINLLKLAQTNRYHIDLPSGLTVTEVDSGDNAETGEEGIIEDSSTTLRLSTTSGIVLADVVANMTSDRDWSDITFGTDIETGKSFVHGLTDAPGTASTFTLYVPKLSGHNAVGICPGADALANVSADCSNLSVRKGSASSVSAVTVDDQAYWKASGLTGTGGFSSEALASTGMDSISLLRLSLLTLVGGSLALFVRRRYA